MRAKPPFQALIWCAETIFGNADAAHCYFGFKEKQMVKLFVCLLLSAISDAWLAFRFLGSSVANLPYLKKLFTRVSESSLMQNWQISYRMSVSRAFEKGRVGGLHQ